MDEATQESTEAGAEETAEAVTDAPTKETEEKEVTQSQEMIWPMPPVPMPAVFDVVSQEVDGDPVVIIAVYTSAGASFAWTTRENALELSSRIKKIAQTGPPMTKQTAPKQTAPKSKLIVPGGKA